MADFAIPPAGHTIRTIIDKTAKRVSSTVGPGGLPHQLREEERRIKAFLEKKNANTSSKLAFLDEDNIYHQYYLLILHCEQEGLSPDEFIETEQKNSIGLSIDQVESESKGKKSEEKTEDVTDQQMAMDVVEKETDENKNTIAMNRKEGSSNMKEVTLVSQQSSRGSAINYALLRYAQLEKKSKALAAQASGNQNINDAIVSNNKEVESKELNKEGKMDEEQQTQQQKQSSYGLTTKYTQLKPYERYLDRRWLLGEPDDCSVYQIELMKVTAMFAACSGNTFLNALRRKEERNKDFSFLLPRSTYSNYFTSLVDAYRCILLSPRPSKSLAYNAIVEEKKNQCQPLKFKITNKNNEDQISMKTDGNKMENRLNGLSITEETSVNTKEEEGKNIMNEQQNESKTDTTPTTTTTTSFGKLGLQDNIMLKLAYDQYPEDVFEGLVHIYEHNRLLEEAAQQKLNEAESERTMYNQVDWQDFEVVHTLDFDPRDLGLVESDSESESEEEEEEVETKVGQKVESMTTKSEAMKVEAGESQRKSEQKVENKSDEEDSEEEGVYREQDDDDEEEEEEEEVVKVRDDYQVSTVTNQGVGKGRENANKVLDPRTGQMIALEDLEEYRRIQFMDPRYEIESKRAEDAKKDTGYAEGAELVANLENVVRKRNALTALEEEEKLQKQEERARKRRMLERQKQESLANANQNNNNNQTDEDNNSTKRKRLEGEDEHDKDAMEEIVTSNLTRHQNPALSSSSMNIDGGISISAPKMINTSNNGVPQVTIHPPISVTGYQAPSILHPPSSLPPPPPPPLEQQQQQLESSSTNGEGELMTETDFLSTYSNEALYPRSQYKFLISFPSSGSSNSSQNQDPDIEIEQIDPSRTIKELKSEIASRYGKLSAPKIQLRTETGTFLKDANTIAYYNLKPGTNLDVVPKTRGGRK